MIAADTSTWIAYLQGESNKDTEILDDALLNYSIRMPPPVLTELLSSPKLDENVARRLSEIPRLELKVGFWIRAGELRRKVFARGRKARLGDALIAQNCIDNGVGLLTRDKDFVQFASAAGLELIHR